MRRHRVLVVEDEPDIAEVVVLLLASSGLDAAVACDLASARRQLSGDAWPSVVLLDRRLPDGDGLELCRELKRGGAAPAVVVMTAVTEGEATVFAAGADACLVKPFDPDRLEALVGRFARAGVACTPTRGAATTGGA